MYKLIALDLDGTLLDDNKKISESNISIIKKLVDSGYIVLIATGRGYFDAKNLIKDINKDLTILANNGNIIRNSLDEKTYYANYLPKEEVKNVLLIGEELGLKPIVHVDYYKDGYDMVIEHDTCDDNMMKYISNHLNRYKFMTKHSIINLDRILEVMYLGNKDILSGFYNILNDKYPNRYSSHILENLISVDGMLEIMTPSMSKWTSILGYSNSIGIRPNEIVAIGDDNNDIEMIANAGLGISMKNGSALAKEAADMVIGFDNNESGVAHALKRVL